jgi:GNAT superfamily N-acetyltransferase
VNVRQIDPNDDDELGGWWAVQHASRMADWPDDSPMTFNAARAMAIGGFGAKRFILAVAEDDAGRVVGCSMLGLPDRDNTWIVEVDIQVHPAHRRHGAGRALALHAEEVAHQEDRTVMTGGYEEPLEAPPPAASFTTALGYVPALLEMRRDLHLPVEAARLDELEAACTPSATGYGIVTWQEPTPDELVAGRLELEGAMVDAPHGDLDYEPQTWDEARLRGGEATMAEIGPIFCAGAIAIASGDLVAFTALGVPRETPENANQFGTMVLAPHRGHRLGMLVKIANVREVIVQSPRTRTIRTWNGETNSYMSQVNDDLGYVVTARSVIVQKHLADLADMADTADAATPPTEGRVRSPAI